MNKRRVSLLKHPLLVGLIVAAASGLAFLAYNHPRGYRLVAAPLGGCLLLLGLGQVAVLMGMAWQSTRDVRRALVDNRDVPTWLLQALVESTERIVFTVVTLAPILAYLTFLWFLPTIVE